MNMYKALDELSRAEKHIKKMEEAIKRFEENPITLNKFAVIEFTNEGRWIGRT